MMITLLFLFIIFIIIHNCHHIIDNFYMVLIMMKLDKFIKLLFEIEVFG